MEKQDRLDWNDYFMSLAILTSLRSFDPNTKVGSVIINKNKKIVGLGYNGMPKIKDKDNDNIFPWSKEDKNPLNNKYLYIIHAELNSIINSNSYNLKNCSLYTTLFPCNECAKSIIQVGIKKIYYLNDKYKDTDSNIAARRMFDAADVEYTEFISTCKLITIKLKPRNS